MPYPSYVSRPKQADKRDRIAIDGTDYSNAFSQFGLTSSKSQEEAGAFNPDGIIETVPGATTQSFTGQMYNISSVKDALWDIHKNDTVVEVQWQEDGLDSNTNSVFYGNCTIAEFSPQSTFGTVTSFQVTFITADSAGIQRAAGT